MPSPVFLPKSFTTLRGYTRAQFFTDATAGVTLGLIALPLAIAFGIASIPDEVAKEAGLSPPAMGLFTAIIAGFLILMITGSPPGSADLVSLANSSVASSPAGGAGAETCLARNGATVFMLAVSGVTIPAFSAMHANSGSAYWANPLARPLQVRGSADSFHAYRWTLGTLSYVP